MLTLYILVWPLISAMILALIVTTFLKEIREAKAAGRKVV